MKCAHPRLDRHESVDFTTPAVNDSVGVSVQVCTTDAVGLCRVAIASGVKVWQGLGRPVEAVGLLEDSGGVSVFHSFVWID
jgi:hypothetical protein